MDRAKFLTREDRIRPFEITHRGPRQSEVIPSQACKSLLGCQFKKSIRRAGHIALGQMQPACAQLINQRPCAALFLGGQQSLRHIASTDAINLHHKIDQIGNGTGIGDVARDLEGALPLAHGGIGQNRIAHKLRIKRVRADNIVKEAGRGLVIPLKHGLARSQIGTCGTILCEGRRGQRQG